jgi:hypothetical protein
MKIILPNTLVDLNFNYGHLFFFAGPVRGGGDWQTKACIEMMKYLPNFHGVVPCRYQEGQSRLLNFREPGKENYFDRQLTWERHYLDIAGPLGCIIFWLPCEDKTFPRTPEDGPYAMDTRGELGEWRGRLMHDSNLRVVIGAEPDFPGISQIQRNFNFATKSEFPIYKTLEETIEAAVKKLSENKHVRQ